MQKYKSTYFLAGLLLIPVLIAGYYFLATNSGKSNLASAEAKGKSKWQKMLERNGVDQAFWSKYLPKISHKEYKKAVKKYQASNYVPSSVAYGDGSSAYALHKNIATTYFWAGEDASGDNYGIPNNSSCWDENWDQHCKNENPFYFALPYNDLDSNGNRKAEALKIIPWANEKNWGENESICKNHWIKVIHDGKTVYAQWEDAGPCDSDKENDLCGETDKNYVFGTADPQFKVGLDVSPAVKNHLGLDDEDRTDWQFIDEKDVPDGPWKQIVTRSGLNWN